LSPGLFKILPVSDDQADPAQILAQHERVQQIRRTLPNFDYTEEVNMSVLSGHSINLVRKDTEPCEGGTYKGEWNALTNLRHGRGVQIWEDGSMYEGFWVDGKKNDRGRLIYAFGDWYEGEWKDDLRHGYGKFTNSEGVKYSGEWKANEQHGKATVLWPNG